MICNSGPTAGARSVGEQGRDVASSLATPRQRHWEAASSRVKKTAHQVGRIGIRSFVIRDRRRLSPAQDRVVQKLWPMFAVDFQARPLNVCELFSRRAPLTVEIGAGRGDFALQHAAQHPESDYLLLEANHFCIAQLLLGIKERGLRNMRFINHDAALIFRHQLPAASIDTICVFFPDPWVKRRHHKRRLLQADFLSCLASRLKSNGCLHIATDWVDYARHIAALIDSSQQLRGLSCDNGLVPRPTWRAVTKYEQRARTLPHDVFDFCLVKARATSAAREMAPIAVS